MSNLNKFITFDIESITNMDSIINEGDNTFLDPIIISAFYFYNKEIYTKILRKNLTQSKEINIKPNTNINKELRLEKIRNLAEFFL